MAWDWAIDFQPAATEGLALDLPGASGDYASTPDSAAVSVDALDFRFSINCADYSIAGLYQQIGGVSLDPSNRAYGVRFTPWGGVQLLCSSDGSGFFKVWQPSGATLVDGQTLVARFTYDNTTGSMAYYESSDGGVSWGTAVDTFAGLGAADLYDASGPLAIGAESNGTSKNLTGVCHWLEVYDGVGGTLAADFNPTRDATLGASTVTSSTTGEVWTINGSAAIVASDVIPNNSRPPVPVTDILGASVNYGKTGEALQYSGGTMTLAIDNASSAYTPGGGGTYTTARFLGVPVKLYANVTGASAPTWTHGPPAVFTGVVTDVSWSFDSAFQSTMTVQVSDMLTMLGTLSFVDVDSGNGLDITAGTAAAALTATLVAANAVTAQVTQTTILNPSGDAGQELLAVTDYIGSAGALAQTVERSDGGDVYVRHGLPVDATNAYNALTFRTRGQQPISGALGTLYLNLPGAWYSDDASTPDSAAVSITGDIDIRSQIDPDEWASGTYQMLVAKEFNDGAKSFYFSLHPTAYLRFLWTTDGNWATAEGHNSTMPTAFTDGDTGWVRVTLDVDNGAGGHDVKFYTSTDGVTWTQLGTTRTMAGTTSIFDSTTDLVIGARGEMGTLPLVGKCYSAQLYDGIDGTLAADFDPTRDASVGDTSFTSSTTGEVWTINGNASINSTIVGLYPLNLWDTSLTPAGDEPHNFARIDFASGAAIAYSQATYTSDGGTAQTAQVPDVNLNEFGARSITRTGLLALNDSATLGLAEHFLQQYGVETIAPLATRGVELPPIVTGDNDGYELVKYSVGDTCTINFRPANASATITIVGVVAGISWSITPAAASLVVRLEDGDQTVGFILDSDAFGRLDINRL